MSIGVFPPRVNGLTLPLAVNQGGTGGADAAEARTNLGLGSMAQQNASAVAITGGSATNLQQCSAIQVSAYGPPVNFTALSVLVDRTGWYGIVVRNAGSDTGPGVPVVFQNIGAVQVGSIGVSATATSYNTSSDARLKHAVTPLTGALDVVQALKPVAFLWNADDTVGHGFAAHELQQIIPEAVTGTPDVLNDDGTINPQQADYSKIVPWLVGAVQELSQQVQVLTARLEEALA